MATIKSYTDLEQSKILAKILPLESADMYYISGDECDICFGSGIYEEIADWLSDGTPRPADIPCWSLAALLNYLREIDFFPNIEADEHGVTMDISYYNEEEARLLAPVHNIKVEAESFTNACCEVIIKLHELNLL